MSPFGVLADDLTGACDTGVAFSARGARVLVLVTPEAPLPAQNAGGAWDVVVQNTESRHLAPAEAAHRVRDGNARLGLGGWPVRYKKIDSTLRGALAAEAAPLLAAGSSLVVAPAFPAAGRTVVGGVLRVGGRPVHQTEIGRDRHNPVPESHLPTLFQRALYLASGASAPVGTLTLGEVQQGEARACVQAIQAQGMRVLVADAESDTHLDTLAEALVEAWDIGAPVVGVGSAGLAHALATWLLPEIAPAPRPAGFPRGGAVLVVAGSRTAVTREQVQALLDEPGTYGLALDAAALDEDDWNAYADAWVAEQVSALRRAAAEEAQTLVVAMMPEDGPEPTPRLFARRSGRLNAALGALARRCADELALAGLVLTGGDIARAVLRALAGEALQLGPEVLPGIPLAWPVGGAQAGLPLVTKAGGFGGPEALCSSVHFLRHGTLRS